MTATLDRPQAHLCVVQPRGELRALAALDLALLWRRQLAAIGVATTMARHAVRPGVPNLVFGAEWGFDLDAAAGLACAWVRGDAAMAAPGTVSPAVQRLAAALPVVDLSRPWIGPAAGPTADAAPTWPCGLPGATVPTAAELEQRPIDLLLLQPVTPRRLALMQAIEAAGTRVARADPTLVADERAALVRQAKAVLWLDGRAAGDAPHAAGDTSVRAAAALAWAEGTPLIAEGSMAAWGSDAAADPAAAAVQWFTAEMAVEYFGAHWRQPAWRAAALQALGGVHAGAAEALASAWQALQATLRPLPSRATPLRRLALSHPDSRLPAAPGWTPAEPLAQAAAPASADMIDAGLVDPRSTHSDFVIAWSLQAAKPGATLVIRLPLRPASSAADAQSAVRAATAGWLAAGGPGSGSAGRVDLAWRWQPAHTGWLDARGLPLAADCAASAQQARLVFTKVEASFHERTQARALRDDFGL